MLTFLTKTGEPKSYVTATFLACVSWENDSSIPVKELSKPLFLRVWACLREEPSVTSSYQLSHSTLTYHQLQHSRYQGVCPFMIFCTLLNTPQVSYSTLSSATLSLFPTVSRSRSAFRRRCRVLETLKCTATGYSDHIPKRCDVCTVHVYM